VPLVWWSPAEPPLALFPLPFAALPGSADVPADEEVDESELELLAVVGAAASEPESDFFLPLPLLDEPLSELPLSDLLLSDFDESLFAVSPEVLGALAEALVGTAGADAAGSDLSAPLPLPELAKAVPLVPMLSTMTTSATTISSGRHGRRPYDPIEISRSPDLSGRVTLKEKLARKAPQARESGWNSSAATADRLGRLRPVWAKLSDLR